MSYEKTKQFVDSLWSTYEENEQLADFKEELAGNMEEKIAALTRKGVDRNAAFEEAAAALGDISHLADQMALRKKREVLEEAYLDTRRYLSAPRVAAYVVFGVVFFFGLIAALISLFSTSIAPFQAFSVVPRGLADSAWTGFFGVLLAFVPAAIAGWTFLGLTQETAAIEALSAKRALWYTGAVFTLSAGIFTFLLTWFAVPEPDGRVIAALGTLLPFALPSLALLVFLGLTETNRLKPWARARQEDELQKSLGLYADPSVSAQFGMYSGGLWILATALFALFGFIAGFQYSWIVFVFATAGQLFVQGAFIKRGAGKS
jgi:hypothetical protein